MSSAAKSVTDGNKIEGNSGKRRKLESDTSLVVATDGASENPEDTKSDATSTKTKRIANAFQTILECLGEDVTRPGIKDTPLRAAKAMQFLTSGYSHTCEGVVGAGVFQEGTEGQMVLVKDIDVNSLCEHHMLPFTGKVHIAYIVGPSRTVLGLSKLARIADMHSRKLQVQERLTRQIACDIMASAEAQGVAVLVEASHMCMVMRGVQKPGSSTSTTSFTGAYESDAALRSEFLALIK